MLVASMVSPNVEARKHCAFSAVQSSHTSARIRKIKIVGLFGSCIIRSLCHYAQLLVRLPAYAKVRYICILSRKVCSCKVRRSNICRSKVRNRQS